MGLHTLAPERTMTKPQQSVWQDAGRLHAPPLASDTECEVCIIGAGVAGLLLADELARRAHTVVVIDAGPVAGGESCRTTAHLVTALDDRYSTLATLHGRRGAQIAAQSHAAAIDHVERTAARLAVDCAWRRLDGYLVVNPAHHQRAGALIDEELAAAADAGLTAERVEQLPRPWPAAGPAVRFPRQGQVHPVRLLNALARDLAARGVRIYTGTRAAAIAGSGPVTVATGDAAGPTITARHAVVATNTPINTVVSVHTKQAGYQTYVAALRIPRGSLPPALMWDGPWEDDRSYRYIRTADHTAEHDLLIVGGEDHKTGQSTSPPGDDPYRCLESWARANFPMCGAVERRWSGEVMEPADGVAYIGPTPGRSDGTWLVTGDSGNGMTHAAVAAMLLPDLIAGRGHPWAALYDPARKPGLHALKDYAQENINTLAQYRDWLKRGTAQSEGDIPPGRGAVVVNGVHHLAVYKDASGRCTRTSAVCPHLGGIVRWNDKEQTWDCPCHASRFDRYGKVIHGPANSDLTPET